MKRAVSVAVVTSLVAAGGLSAWPAFAEGYRTACAAALVSHRFGDPGTVHTSRWKRPDEIADLGDYRDIHWQVTSPRRLERRYPRTQACSYQLVVRLRENDATALLAQIQEEHMNDRFYPPPAPEVWPALRKFVPTDSRWVIQSHFVAARVRQLFLDDEYAVAVVNYYDDSD